MSQHNSNPYHNVGLIKISNQFLNRKTLVSRVLNSLFSYSAQCQSIIGQMKIGKSSFVEHISDPDTIAQFKYDGSKHLFIYINCSMPLRSAEDFYRLLLHRPLVGSNKTLRDFVSNYTANLNSPCPWQEEWESVLKQLASNHFYVIVILDEFDKAILRGNLLKDGLFDSLRFYSSEPNFAWIVCTLQSLPKLFDQAFRMFGISNDERMSFSEFYNIVSDSHVIGLFEWEDIDELITSPAESERIIFTREEKQAIRSLGGRFPYFIQRACYHFFEAHSKGTVKYEEILEDYLRDAQPIWADYWNKLAPLQQKLLFSIASGHPVEASPDVQRLKHTALIYEEHGRWFPFSEEFGRFILSIEHPYEGFPVNPGDVLWKQYEVEEVAGRTLHSQVVKAQDIYLKRHWAIKLLCVNQDHTDDQVKELHRNLLREAEILDSLEHKNIGKVHGVRPDPLGVIMQWVDGNSLDMILEECIALPVATVIKIGIQLANALHYAHAQGIVHRDIKPPNIILTPEGEPILIDFDIARSKKHQTITHSESDSPLKVRTPHYCAPEQFGPPDQVGPSADIFALGVVLYELITHERPYRYGNDPEKYAGQFPMPEQHDIPDSLYQILCKLICQQPEQRPKATEVYEELQVCLRTLKANNEKAIQL